MVPAGPVNSPTWRKRTEEEREGEREGGTATREGSKGEGKVCRCDRSRRGRRQAIWVREEEEEEDWRRGRRDEQARA